MNRAQRRAAQYKRAARALPYALTDEGLAPIRALYGSSAYAEGATVEEHLKTRAAYERLLDGSASLGDFDRVSMAINIAKQRAVSIDEALADMLERAQDVMGNCKARYLRCGRFGFDGPGIQVMAAAMDHHEAITDASSPLQMQQALLAVQHALR